MRKLILVDDEGNQIPNAPEVVIPNKEDEGDRVLHDSMRELFSENKHLFNLEESPNGYLDFYEEDNDFYTADWVERMPYSGGGIKVIQGGNELNFS